MDTVWLTDENGRDIEFEVMDWIKHKGEEYVVLLPMEEESDEIVILRMTESDEEGETYCAVEDETVLQEIFDLFKERLEEFDEEEEELMTLFEELFDEE